MAQRSDSPSPDARPDVAVERVADPDDAAALGESWHQIAEASSAQPTMTPEYALNWWRHQGKGRLHLLVARREGRVVGVAPLHRRMMGPVPYLRWLGHGTGSVGHVVVGADDAPAKAALWRAVFDEPGGFDLVDVPRRELPEFPRSVTVELTDENRCPTAILRAGWNVSDYLSGGLRKRARRELARTQRRLTEGGGSFTIRSAQTFEELATLSTDLLQIYDAAEDMQPRLHLMRGDLAPFFSDYLTDSFLRGQLDVFVGYINDRPAAFDVLVTVGQTSHTILGRFDPAARQWGVGHLMMEAMVERALLRRSTLFNLQIGDDDYKRAWADNPEDGDEVVHVIGSARGRVVIEAVKLRSTAFDAVAKARSSVSNLLGIKR